MNSTCVISRIGALSAVLLLGVACVEVRPYINANPSIGVKTSDSRAHAFEYVKIAQDGDELVVYGKVAHRHDICESDGHVDLAIIAPGGSVAYATSLPLTRGSRVHGWHGAAFRTRVAFRLAPEHVVRLAFHGERCSGGEVVDGNHRDVDGAFWSDSSPPSGADLGSRINAAKASAFTRWLLQ